MSISLRRFSIICLFLSFPICINGAAAQQCPKNAHVDSVEQDGNLRTVHCKCDDGYENSGGACQRIDGTPQCVQRAGEQLKRDQQQGCARVVGTCFTKNKISLSIDAAGCVAACRQVAGCAIGCGIFGLAAENVIASCVDAGNSCFEAALARHKQAVAACK